MSRPVWLLFLLTACTEAPSSVADGEPPAELDDPEAPAGDPDPASPYAGCTQTSHDENGDLNYTRVYDEFGWPVRYESPGTYGLVDTTTYEREAGRVVYSETTSSTGFERQAWYDEHEHLLDMVETWPSGTTEATAYLLEHDGERLTRLSHDGEVTSFDDCGGGTTTEEDGELIIVSTWTYEQGCTPTRVQTEYLSGGFVVAISFDQGRMGRVVWSGSVEGVDTLEYDCP